MCGRQWAGCVRGNAHWAGELFRRGRGGREAWWHLLGGIREEREGSIHTSSVLSMLLNILSHYHLYMPAVCFYTSNNHRLPLSFPLQHAALSSFNSICFLSCDIFRRKAYIWLKCVEISGKCCGEMSNIPTRKWEEWQCLSNCLHQHFLYTIPWRRGEGGRLEGKYACLLNIYKEKPCLLRTCLPQHTALSHCLLPTLHCYLIWHDCWGSCLLPSLCLCCPLSLAAFSSSSREVNCLQPSSFWGVSMPCRLGSSSLTLPVCYMQCTLCLLMLPMPMEEGGRGGSHLHLPGAACCLYYLLTTYAREGGLCSLPASLAPFLFLLASGKSMPDMWRNLGEAGILLLLQEGITRRRGRK